MAIVGFHASHEQIDPRTLLLDLKLAEQAGFQAAMCSDHFAPWSNRQGESGHAWAWLGAALESTSLTLGTVSAPGQRYHPAVAAQAIATLGVMYPNRFWVALGSGEALNEHITGDPWPSPKDRDDRLEECVQIMKALLAGQEVTHAGWVLVDRARVYSRPDEAPRLLVPAVTPATARRGAGWADGLITVNQSHATLRQVLQAFKDGGGQGKSTALQVHVSYAGDEETALAIAMDQWAPLVLGPPLAFDLETPEHFEQIAGLARPEDIRKAVLVSADPDWFVDELRSLATLGFDELYLHHVGKEQTAFIETFGRRVLPHLRG